MELQHLSKFLYIVLCTKNTRHAFLHSFQTSCLRSCQYSLATLLMISIRGAKQLYCYQIWKPKSISYKMCLVLAIMFSKKFLTTHFSKGSDYGPMALRPKGQRHYTLTFVLHAVRSSPLRLTEIGIQNPATHYLNFAVAVALSDSLLVVMLQHMSPRLIG